MSLERLREVLSKRALYFCRCDLFDDSFEGALSKPAAHHQDRFLSVLRQRGQEESFAQSAFAHRRMYRKFFFANCWHISDVESLSMWGLYVPGLGVAIETTFANLRASLDAPETGRLVLGKVRYVNFDLQMQDILGPIDVLFTKRAEFRHESELRVLYHYFPEGFYSDRALNVLKVTADMPGYSAQIAPEECNFDVDMPRGAVLSADTQRLVQRVVVSPKAPPAFKKEADAVVQQYLSGVLAEASRLDEPPIF